MKPKHTPGPWSIDQNDKYIHIIDRNSGIGPCMIPLNGGEMREEDVANARLIASAPELLEALDKLVCKLTDMNSKGQIMDDDDVNTLIRDAFDLSERIKATDGAE